MFQKGRSTSDPTHKHNLFCGSKVQLSYKSSDGDVSFPLFQKLHTIALDSVGFTNAVEKITPLPDARNNAVYKCVQTKPTSGIFYPSKWQDAAFLADNEFYRKYYVNKAIVSPLSDNSTGEYYGVKRKFGRFWGLTTARPLYVPERGEEGASAPGNFGKYFFGFDKRTMCDEELHTLVQLGRKNKYDWLKIFPDNEPNKKSCVVGGKTLNVQSPDDCGECMSYAIDVSTRVKRPSLILIPTNANSTLRALVLSSFQTKMHPKTLADARSILPKTRFTSTKTKIISPGMYFAWPTSTIWRVSKEC